MNYGWREILERERSAGIPGIEAYAAELDAVDMAVAKTLATREEPVRLSPFGWGDQARPGSFRSKPWPVVPVAADDEARVAVAVLQRLFLHRRESFLEGGSKDILGTGYVLLAMGDRLMRRKLAFSTATASALVEVLIRDREYLSLGMQQVERSCPPPVDAVLR